MNTLPDIYIVVRFNEIGGLEVLDKYLDFKDAVARIDECFRALTEEDGYKDGTDCTSYRDDNGNLVSYEFDGDEEGTIFVQIIKC